MEEAFIVLGAAIEADQQVALAIQPCEGAFDDPAVATEARFRFDPAARNPRFDPALATRPPALPVIVRLVGMRFVGAPPRPAAAPPLQRGDRVEQLLEQLAVIDVRPAQAEGERNPLGVDHKMAFATRLAFIRWIRADGVAPLFAATLELSMATRLQSISSAHANCLSNTPWRRRQTPRWVHCWKRRQQVDPLPQPISSGRYCHGVPVRKIKRIPVSVARFDTRGRPPFLPGFRSFGSRGSTATHSSSVTRGFMVHRRISARF